MAMPERSVAIGVFATMEQARQAIDALKRAGYSEQEIGFLTRAANNPDAAATDTANAVGTNAAAGGVIGGLIGAVLSLFVPGIGPAIAGGILAATLSGAALGAAAGGLIGILTSMGVSEEEANYYQRELEAGKVIVTVKAAVDDYAGAVDILRQNGASTATTEHSVYNPTNPPVIAHDIGPRRGPNDIDNAGTIS